MKTRYSIAFAPRDVFGIVPGSGWVILENGKRIDWPMLAAKDEAEADLLDFNRNERQLARDEASEQRGLAMMNGCLE